MSREPTVVVMVKKGTWGSIDQEDAHQYLEMIAGLLRDAKREDLDTNEQVPVATVEIVATVEDARRRIATHPHVDVVIFNSRSQLVVARLLKNEYHGRRLRVVVMSGGGIDDEEVVIVDKSWLDVESTPKILL